MGKDANEAKKVPSTRKGFGGYETRWYEPEEADKERLRAGFEEAGLDVVGELLTWVEKGWKVSLNLSRKNGGFIGSLTCNDRDSDFYKLVFITQNAEGGKLVFQMVDFLQNVLESGRINANGDVQSPSW